MTSDVGQTWPIIRLNFNRLFLKGYSKYSLFLITALTVLIFAMNQGQISKGSQDTSTPASTVITGNETISLYYDNASMDPTTRSKLQSVLERFQATPVPKEDFMNRSKSDSYLLTFQSPTAYTIGFLSYTDIEKVYECVNPRSYSCEISFSSLNDMARIKFNIDSALSGQAIEPSLIDFYNAKHVPALAYIKSVPNGLYPIFFIVLGIVICSALIEDRTKGIKFGLFMTGVKRSSYYIGFFFMPLVFIAIYSIITLYITLTYIQSSNALGPVVLLLFFSAIGQLSGFWLISQLSKTTRSANTFIFLFMLPAIASCSGGYKSLADKIPYLLHLVLCFNPAYAFGLYGMIISMSPVGAGFSSMKVPYFLPSVNELIILSGVFSFTFLMLAIYFDWLHISQDETRPFYYPISQFFTKAVNPIIDGSGINSPSVEMSNLNNVPDTEKVIINNLSKAYSGSSTYALREVSLEFQKGEIFGLLGYNGAGKSTLINILCGILSPTEGSIQVFGLNAHSDRYKIAQKTGICSQQDILYDDLTVYEHLYYFGLMRGVPKTRIESVIQQLKADLKIDDIMYKSLTKVLSGGQKRKLCIALAFINDPELVILDEMSSGMDPENRRVIWDFLLKKKQNRAILMCTHFMDEADIVAERKAMLTLGSLVCIGSSSYLKKVYQTGYTLSIEKSRYFKQRQLDEFFREQNVNVVVRKQTPELIEYTLPSQNLNILAALEQNQSLTSALLSYSIKENGLQDIFSSKLLVQEEDLTISQSDSDAIIHYYSQFKDPSDWAKTKFLVYFEWRRFWSESLELFIQLIIPILFLVLTCVLFTSQSNSNSAPKNAIDVHSLAIYDTFVNRLIPDGLVFQTPIQQLEKYKGFVSSSTPVEVFLNLGNVHSTFPQKAIVESFQGFAGAPFLALKALRPDLWSTYQTSIEAISYSYIKMNLNRIMNAIFGFVFSLILIFDVSVVLTDIVAESKAKIKYLLISFGVPLASYWLVMAARLVVIVLPFIIALMASVPPDFAKGSVFYLITFVQTILFCVVVGTYFSKETARGIIQTVRYGAILFAIVILTVGALTKWSLDTYKQVSAALLFCGPMQPIGVFISLTTQGEAPETGVFLSSTASNLVIYISMIIYIEMGHLFIRNVSATGQTEFVNFNQVRKAFTTGFFKRTTKVAVNDLSLGIKRGELFALLGPNGCGKTTTLSMLTAQQIPDKGSIHMNGLHVASKKLDVIKRIGFCPQFDDLLVPTMTVEAHLALFCEMNGIGEKLSGEYITLLLNAFGITRFRKVACGSLSGGTKRKVSATIAVMLPRSLVVLDEPTTGLDPLARQKLWNSVRLLNRNRTTIMTTHYINETSTCDRIAIMSSGKLKCCDSEFELSKMAQGYQLTVRMFPNHPPAKLMEWVHGFVFQGDSSVKSELESVVGDQVEIRLRHFTLSVGQVVERMDRLVSNQNIMDYSFSRLSLENVFLDIVKDESPKLDRL